MLAINFTKRTKVWSWLSPVILCYGIGILLANLDLFELSSSVSNNFRDVTVLLAIPLLLFSTDIIGWLKLAKSTILSFILCVISGLVISIGVAFFLSEDYPNAWQLSGMLVGVFTGGIPNLNAIGIAVGAEETTFIYLNVADIVVGGTFLFFLMSFAPPLYKLFLPEFEFSKEHQMKNDAKEEDLQIKDMLFAILLSLLILGGSVGITLLLFEDLEASTGFLLLLISALSVLASLSSKVRNWKGAFETGDYLLLMFCIAIGMLADFGNISTDAVQIIFYMAVVWIGTVVLHLLLSRFFKIDRDTTIITSTAALYGPPFIGQIASVINNRSLIFSGIATGLVGYAIGNFLGVGVANFLKNILQ